nr:NUDIX domain-containing protein [Polaromonas sp. CG_9.11]
MPFTRLEVVVLTVFGGGLNVLLAKRADAPYAGKWALPGGALRIDLDQTLDAGARRVMHERLGIELLDFEQLCAVGGAKRYSPAPWALSVVYRALISIESVEVIAEKQIDALEWRPVESVILGPLAFDHADLIERAVDVTRKQVDGMGMPRGLLAEHFTLTELQVTCEQVLGRPIDKSSFRRKLTDRGMVEAVEGAMKGGAFRPAQLFRWRIPAT